MININFTTNRGKACSFIIHNKNPLNTALKEFFKKMNIPENFIDELFFLNKGCILDIKSEKSLNEHGIKDNETIFIGYDNGDTHEIIKLNNLKKNIRIIHNRKLIFNCIQCNLEICDKC